MKTSTSNKDKMKQEERYEHIIFKTFLIRKILIYLYNHKIDYILNIYKKSEIVWTGYASRVFKDLIDNNLIELFNNKGKKHFPFVYSDKRIKYYKLTKKGENIAKLLIQLNNDLNKLK